MKTYDAESYQRLIMSYLEKLSDRLRAELRLLLSNRFHPDVALVDIEVFADGLEWELPVRLFLMDKGNNEVFHDDPGYFPESSMGFLVVVERVIPDDLVDGEALVDVQDALEEAGVDTSEVETQAIIAWFAACWQQAGGGECPLPAYICAHDDIRSFDLKQMEWAPDAEGKWKYFDDE